MTVSPQKLAWRGDLQGLRAIAIATVVGFHFALPGFEGGFVGVSVFFVLSGFLISQQLFHEIDNSGSINLPYFIARRISRLGPALAATILLTLVIGVARFDAIELRQMAGSGAHAAAYLSNLRFASAAGDYLRGDLDKDPFLHTWSLSIEEQIYLVWPLVLLLALRSFGLHTPVRKLCITLALTALSLYAFHFLDTTGNGVLAFYLAPTRFWEFGIGATIAASNRSPKGLARYSDFARFTGMSLIFISTILLDRDSRYPGISSIPVILGTALLITYKPNRESPSSLDNILSGRPAQWLGSRSYSVYLLHWPLIALFGPASELSTTNMVALLVLMLAASDLSFRCFELPYLRHPRNSNLINYKTSIASITALGVVGCASLIVQWQSNITAKQSWRLQLIESARREIPTVYQTGCHAKIQGRSNSPENCIVLQGLGAPLILLTGDSHAAQWYPAIRSAAAQLNWSFVSLTRSACSLLTPSLPVPTYRNRPYPQCSSWQEMVKTVITNMRPDIIITSSAASQKTQDELEPQIDQLNTLTEIAARIEADLLLIGDTPRSASDPLSCLARVIADRDPLTPSTCGFNDNSAYRNALNATLTEAANRNMHVHYMTMDTEICPDDLCRVIIDETITYRDSHHLTSTFSETLADAFIHELRRIDTPLR